MLEFLDTEIADLQEVLGRRGGHGGSAVREPRTIVAKRDSIMRRAGRIRAAF